MEHIISIDENGDATFLLNDFTRELVGSGSVTRRASHVEPCNVALRVIFHSLRYLFGEYGKVSQFTRLWRCNWRVNLSPVNGPVLPGAWRDRAQAIDAEVVWLNQNFI